MKQIACECGYLVRGATDQELMSNAMAHMRDAHPDVAGTVTPEQLLAMAEVVD
jgi:predicted small metal-binding protein